MALFTAMLLSPIALQKWANRRPWPHSRKIELISSGRVARPIDSVRVCPGRSDGLGL
ncbi:hypothetical protein ASPCADRAFT_210211, partial [Aspergillus carbonarius ITEM 5010]